MGNISDIIESDSFKKELKDSIESGLGVDYAYDGDNEYPVDTIDVDRSFNEVIKVIKKFLVQ